MGVVMQRHVDAKVEAPSTITFRDAVRSDLRAMIDLLADDMLGAHREILSDTPDPKYMAAFQEIEQQSGNRIIVAIDEGEYTGRYACIMKDVCKQHRREHRLWRGECHWC